MTQISILPPNSTPMERALEATFAARLDALPLPVGQMMNPATCPAAFLPWLAWALSVDEWSPDWTEETQRAAIAASIGVHRRKGTVAALRAAIAAAGYGDVEVIEKYGERFYDGSARYNGGDDNYAIGTDDFGNTAFWAQTQTLGGVTFNQVEVRASPITGAPQVIYDAVGTLAATASFGYISAASLTAAKSGQQWTVSAIINVIGQAGGGSGAAQIGAGIRVFQAANPAAPVGALYGDAISDHSNAVSTNTRTLTSDTDVRCGIQLIGSVGNAINARIAIEGLQFEIAPTRTVLTYLPFVYAAADHWAEFRLNFSRPITIAQADQIRRIVEQVTPARCKLRLMTYEAALHTHDGTITYDGTYTHGGLA